MEKKRIIRDDGRYVLLYSTDCSCHQGGKKECCCEGNGAGEKKEHCCHTIKLGDNAQTKQK